MASGDSTWSFIIGNSNDVPCFICIHLLWFEVAACKLSLFPFDLSPLSKGNGLGLYTNS